ncbi:DUF1648 domain-containing protein [Leucobacter sp. HNU]|uniref:DUF1648 domain-containing protein n=1 Tax=Leucobacter sp. HNU TaxID=3236805 RepID=UPI003A810A7D
MPDGGGDGSRRALSAHRALSGLRVATLACIGCVALTILIAFPSVPETVPVHFGPSGAADARGPRATVFAPLAILVVLSSALFWASGDPKRVLKPDERSPGRAERRARIACQTLILANAGIAILLGGLLLSMTFGWTAAPLLLAGASLLLIAVGSGIWRTLRASMPHRTDSN